ncbi:uncharacterized protein LOC125064742 isoform X2 [Vanessa atalanta]|uniref:uncharacterized protein LOC125064742 isoform X2 n=1 Tax=Vanessa atalanta TaxID=42275 RepID=UPI001FCD2C90|nr:uncharacterized protein LOC125064742 isoform X2 [Vanessa atalanta]
MLIYSINKKTVQPHSSKNVEGGLGKMHYLRDSCCGKCVKIIYVLLSVINIIEAIALMAVAVSAAIAMKIFSSEQSGRLVALIIIAVIAAITLSITIYAMVALLRNQRKPVHSGSMVLVILAIILSIIIGVTMKIREEDEVKLSQSLSKSFQLSREDNPRYVKLWATIQNDLTCCGVYSSEDYRNPNLPIFFPPDVPISCCPNYDPSRSQLVQERERESCKVKKQYYDMGCSSPVIELFRDMTKRVMTVSILLIISMVWLSIHGAMWTRWCMKQSKCEDTSRTEANSQP